MPFFFIPITRHLEAQVSPPPGICYQRQKMLMLGVSWEEGGELKLTDAIIPCVKYTVGLVSCCLLLLFMCHPIRF